MIPINRREAPMDTNECLLQPWECDFNLPDRFNMVDLLLERHVAGDRAHRTAIICRNRETTYHQLGRMTNTIGNGLIQIGLKPGERVIILLHDGPEYIALFLAAMKIGAVPVPINMLATAKDMEYFIRDSQAAVVVMESDLYGKLEMSVQDMPNLKALVIHGQPIEGIVNLSHLMETCGERLEPHPTSKYDPSYWLYTSGTTGPPKGVVHLHKDLVYAVETWGRHVVDFSSNDRVLCTSKLFFSYGLNNALYLPLYFGASVILNPDRPLPGTILDLIQRHRPTGLFSVPTAYGQTLNHLEETEKTPDLASLRFCVSAGEALPGSLYRRWLNRFGLEILDGLGSSEVSFIYISNRPGKVKENASGQPLPGYRIEVRDDTGRVLPPCEVGELWVRSQTLFHSYWNQPDKSVETLVDGWMKTGDMGYIDADGYFFYCARANDTMKVSGIWVSPLEVENALLEHPAVAECAVVGEEDEMGLTKPKAFISLKSSYQPGEELSDDLKRHVKQTLAPYKYPRSIEFVSDLPKTATGKIQRFKLRRTASDSCSCISPD